MKLMASLRRLWGQVMDKRTSRERIALMVMVVTIAGAMWLQLLWSAHHSRARLVTLIAELQTKNDAMRHAVASMLAAKAQGAVVRSISAEQAVTAFGDGLRGSGIPGLAVLPDAHGKVRLAGNAEFDVWIAWLAKAHAEYGVQVLHAAIEPTGQAGMAKIEATLALPEVR